MIRIKNMKLYLHYIEMKRCIWDKSCKDFKNYNAKREAFKEIVPLVIHDFHKLTESQQGEACT